jgi:hypothetical protein
MLPAHSQPFAAFPSQVANPALQTMPHVFPAQEPWAFASPQQSPPTLHAPPGGAQATWHVPALQLPLQQFSFCEQMTPTFEQHDV